MNKIRNISRQIKRDLNIENEVYINAKGEKGIIILQDCFEPVFYPDSFEDFCMQYTKFVTSTEDAKKHLDYIINVLPHFNLVKQDLILCAVPLSGVEDEVVTFRFLDLEFYVKAKMGWGCEQYLVVTNDVLTFWKVKSNEVFEAAKRNMKYAYYSRAGAIADPIKDDFIVITTKQKMFGAAAINFKKLFKNLANVWDNDLYIIPSSTNEIICLPTTYTDQAVEDLNNIIKEINQTLTMKERVANHCYVYIKELDRIVY